MGLIVSRNLNQFPDGTAAAPGITFINNPNIGFYTSGGYMYFILGGVTKAQLTNTGFGASAFYPNTSTAVLMQGRIADAAGAIASKLYSLNTLTGAGSKITSFYNDNNTTEKAYISKDGILGSGTLIANAAGTVAILNDSADVAEANVGWFEVQTVNGTRYRVPIWAI